MKRERPSIAAETSGVRSCGARDGARAAAASRCALRDLPVPEPGPGQVLLRVHACGVCRTDLHVVDGELPGPKLPLVPGHEIVGTVSALGPGVDALRDRRARRRALARLDLRRVPRSAARGRENLCADARFTGYQIDGGYAEYAVADARFCFPLPDGYGDVEAAPAALRRADRLPRAAHGRRRASGSASTASAPRRTSSPRWRAGRGGACSPSPAPGDDGGAGASPASWARTGPAAPTEPPPEPLDAAIIFAPVGALVPAALRAVAKGGTVVCAGIHMSDIPTFPYAHPVGRARACARSPT